MGGEQEASDRRHAPDAARHEQFEGRARIGAILGIGRRHRIGHPGQQRGSRRLGGVPRAGRGLYSADGGSRRRREPLMRRRSRGVVRRPHARRALDRRQRVLWSGRLLAGPGGGVRAITFDRATVLPGGDHSGLDEADPRDRGAGVRALAVLPEARDGVDLAVLEAAPAVGTPWRLHRLDRTGATVKRPLLLPRGERDPEVRALAAWEDGYVALALGMQRYSSSPDGHLLAGERIPPPVVERTTIEWETLGRGAAGRLYLAGRPGMIVSTGEDPPRLIELAWR